MKVTHPTTYVRCVLVSSVIGLFFVAGCAQPPLAVSPQTACQIPLAVSLYAQHYYCGGR